VRSGSSFQRERQEQQRDGERQERDEHRVHRGGERILRGASSGAAVDQSVGVDRVRGGV
jgi:hypothetical protein